MAFPDWVEKYRTKGTAINKVKDKYYLYRVHSERIKGTNKVRKINDEYLGRITEEGLIPPKVKSNDYVIKIFGLTAFIFSSCEKIIKSLIIRFPSRYNKLFPLAIIKYFFNNDLNEYNEHYFSILFPNITLKKEKDSIQNEIDRIVSMLDYTITKILNGVSLDVLKKQLSTLYIVNVKDDWTVAKYNDDIKRLINKYSINTEENTWQK